MINFETRCELQKPELLLKYSVLHSREAAAADFVSTLAFPLLFATLVTMLVVDLDGIVSKASPEK